LSRDELVLLLTSAVDFLSDGSLPAELTTISDKLSAFRQQFISITGPPPALSRRLLKID